MSSVDYSELYGVLLMLGKSYISKLPIEIIRNIKINMKTNYIPEYHINEIDYENDLSQETLKYLNYLYLEYWENHLDI